MGDEWQFQAHGVFYATDRSGELTVQRLPPVSADAAALTIDRNGRPNMLLSHSADGTKELLYAMAP